MLHEGPPPHVPSTPSGFMQFLSGFLGKAGAAGTVYLKLQESRFHQGLVAHKMEQFNSRWATIPHY
jgi:hypothetical protein